MSSAYDDRYDRAYPYRSNLRPGMYLRDYFAAKAMLAAGPFYPYGDASGDEDVDEAARRAYEIADAMMQARKV